MVNRGLYLIPGKTHWNQSVGKKETEGSFVLPQLIFTNRKTPECNDSDSNKQLPFQQLMITTLMKIDNIHCDPKPNSLDSKQPDGRFRPHFER